MLAGRLPLQGRAGRRPRQGRLPVQLHPQRHEDAYAAGLRRLTREHTRATEAALAPLVARYARTRQDDDLGAIGAEVPQVIAGLQVSAERRIDTEDWRHRVLTTARQVDRFNRHQIGRQVKSVLGFDVLAHDGYDLGAADDWTSHNVALIKSIPRQYLDQVQDVVMQGFQRGERPESIAKAIQERGGVAESRATLIAVDQVGKLNAALTERRHADLGVKHYFWRTSLDNRVRPAHREREGKRFAYDAPPPDGNPGKPVRCRCRAEPDLNEALAHYGVGPISELTPVGARDLPEALRRGGGHAAKLYRALHWKPDVPPLPAAREALAKPRTGELVPLDARQQLADQHARWLRGSADARAAATHEQRRDWLLWEWVHGSNRKTSVLIKHAAIREFGLRGIPFSRVAHRFSEADIAGVRGDLRKMYRTTQAEFRRQGTTKVHVWRGYAGEEPVRGAVASWSTRKDVAEKFARAAAKRTGKEMRIDEDWVPVERILSWRGGPGWVDGIYGDQAEYMVMF